MSYRPLLDTKRKRPLSSDYMQCLKEILSQMDIELYVTYYVHLLLCYLLMYHKLIDTVSQ